MKKNLGFMKLISIFLITLIIVVGCGKKQVEENNNSKVEAKVNEENSINIKNEENTLKEYDIEIKSLFDFRANENSVWTLDKPNINPLGNEDSYSSIEVIDETSYYLTYLNSENVLEDKEVYGKVWHMIIPYKEEKTSEIIDSFLYDIENYAKDINCEIKHRYRNSLVFNLKENDGSYWWANAYLDSNNDLKLDIIKEKVLKIGETLVINPKDYDNTIYYFTTYNEDNNFQSATFDITNGYAEISAINRNQYGNYIREFNFSRSLSESEHLHYVADNLMIDGGSSFWSIEWFGDDIPDEITLTIQNTGKIEKVNYGEALGAILVEAENVYSVEVNPTGKNSLFLSHPLYSYGNYHFDKMPNGDYIIYVPSGYWDVIISPLSESSISSYRTTMVPVNTGQMTKVKVPFSLTNEIQSKIGGIDEGINISEIDEVNDQVKMRFSLVDKETQEILPSKENSQAYEGNTKVDIDSIKRVKIPPNVILIIDSSGSMKGQMEKTIDSAKAFISGLPENANVQLIDFDSKVKPLNGMTKNDALNNLSQVKVGGATVLYDAVIEGIKMLENKERATIVLFTDGEDENLDSTDRGSIANKEKALSSIIENNVPIYAIGFGENPDKVTLGKFSEISNGHYFNAMNKEALDEVFQSINDKLSNTFELTYTRPKESQLCDIPVVSFVIDTSGSMTETSGDYNTTRITDVKNLYHDFVTNLPNNIQMQLIEFNQDINLLQAMTMDKTKILREIGDLYASGGTDILGSVEIGYKMLKSVPSTTKVLVYLTDAALEVDDEDLDYFNLLLDKIKEDHIKVLWIGIGVENSEDAFIYAAEKSNGKYIITEDANILKENFDVMINEVTNAPKSNLTSAKIIINKVTDLGERNNYSSSILKELSPRKESSIVSESETINYSFLDLPKMKDANIAKIITGDSLDHTESKIDKRISLEDSNSNNDAIDLKSNEIIFLTKLKGLEPPEGYRFMAITVDIKNIIKEQEVMVYPDGSGHPSSWVSKSADGKLEKIKIPYLIPNFSSHFFVNYNNSGSYPASNVTWLAEKSIVVPGDYSLTINPGEIKNGTLIFLIPDTQMSEVSLHYYDTNYGHINIPLVGKMVLVNENIDYLPKTSEGKLTDTFSMAINGYKDLNEDELNVEDFYLNNSVFRKVEANFISKVQALININPMERVKLMINTNKGDFYISINELTSLMPAGFISKIMISPGSFNKVYMGYQIPNILKDNDFQIFVELKDEDAIIGNESNTKTEIIPDYKSEYFNFAINNVSKIKEGDFENCVVVDITIDDIKDDNSSYGIPDLFYIQSEDYVESDSSGFGGNDEKRNVYDATFNQVLGFSDDTVVFDGTNRRGLLLFQLSDYNIDKKWYLKSTFNSDINVLVNDNEFDNNYFVEKAKFETDSYYEEKFNDILIAVIEKYKGEHPEVTEDVNYAADSIEKQSIEPPMISIYGSEIYNSINSVDKLKSVLNGLKYIPTKRDYIPFTYKYSKEAVLTQGFGSEGDLANLALRTLSKLGYSPKLKIADLSEKGSKILMDITGVSDINITKVPAIVYKDKEKTHTFVIPFMTDIDHLRGLVYFANKDIPTLESEIMSIEINVSAISNNENLNKKASDMSDALAGETEGEIITDDINLFNESINLEALSLDAIDIGFIKNGDKIKALVMTKAGNLVGYDSIDLKEYDIKSIEIRFAQYDRFNKHVTYLGEKESIDEVFFTVSINSPDLSENATQSLKDSADKIYKKAQNPNELSALKWYNRSIINDFIAKQSLNDQELSNELDLILGRTSKERIIVVTNKANDINNMSIDLVDVINETHNSEIERNNSFNIISGIIASSLESKVINGRGIGIDELWDENQELILIEPYVNEDYLQVMRDYNVPENLIRYIDESNNYILIQKEPKIINNEKRFAWYEINPETYEMISKIDTFENGAFVSYEVVDAAKNAANFAVGAFKGVETSVWAVCVFSLETNDYKEILKNAKALAMGISKRFENIGVDPKAALGLSPEISQGIGPIKATYDGKGVKISDDCLGFQKGFEAGVNYYFENAK